MSAAGKELSKVDSSRQLTEVYSKSAEVNGNGQ